MTTPIEGMTPVPEDGLREALRTLIEVNETTCFQLRRWGREQSADYLADQIAVARAALARSTPVPAANVSEGLREALRDVMSVNHSPFLGSDGIRECQCAIHENARAALAHAAPERLDVERLAKAEWTVDQGNWFLEMEDARAWAKEVAAEYVRLSQPDATECVECDEPSHDIDYHDHHWHPLDNTTYIGEAHSQPDATEEAGRHDP